MEHATVKKLIEGHARFCRGCGHDLVGLTGCKCPRCGRVYRPGDSRRGRAGAGTAGKWVVAAVLLGGLILALVALKFRRPPARRSPGPAGLERVQRPAGSTAPVTRPVLVPRDD